MKQRELLLNSVRNSLPTPVLKMSILVSRAIIILLNILWLGFVAWLPLVDYNAGEIAVGELTLAVCLIRLIEGGELCTTLDALQLCLKNAKNTDRRTV